jgi:hypothetical protein
MSEREDNVYKAKLAEQAERYDGKLHILYNVHYKLKYLCLKIAEFRFDDSTLPLAV